MKDSWREDAGWILPPVLVIIDQLTKMVYYKPLKITMDIFGLIEAIIDIKM